MIDWFVVLTPLLVLPIVLLLGFVGCQVFFPVDPYGVYVTLEIGSGCDAGVSSISVDFSSDIAPGQFNTTVSQIPSEAFSISTADLPIKIEDKGIVYCLLGITPADGSEPLTRTAQHDKIEDELVESFQLTCQDGSFDLS